MNQGKPPGERNPFQQCLSDFYRMRRALRGRRGDVWHPSTDVYETDEHIVIKASLPGVEPAHIKVDCNGEVITICGVRQGPDRQAVRTYHQMEIPNGYFERRVAIHRPFDPREARAEYREGFLYVRVPKAQEPVRYVISIRLNA